jgi:hypothetical protein
MEHVAKRGIFAGFSLRSAIAEKEELKLGTDGKRLRGGIEVG